MTFDPLLLSLAIGVNLCAAVGAYAKRAVSGSGAVGGLLVGAAILYTGGFLYWIALMLFFGSSTVASRLGGSVKERLSRVHEKSDRRDIVQVVANAGVPVGALLLLVVSGDPGFAVAAAAAFASANADTWASEIGVLSRHPPRSILTRRTLEPGTSGGTTALGSTAAAAGSLLIGLWFAGGFLLSRWTGGAALWQGFATVPHSPVTASALVFLAGTLGSMIDSVLGATIQGQFETPDGSYTERRFSESAEGPVRNRRVRGIRFVTNDLVNLLTSALSATLGALMAGLVL